MDNSVYIGSCAGIIYALDVADGSSIWEFDVSVDGASQFHGNPLIIGDTIYVGTDEGSFEYGTLYAINRLDGTLVWKSTGHSGMASDAISIGDSLIFVITRDDSLLAIDLHDGTIIWAFNTGWIRPDIDEYLSIIEAPRIVSSPIELDGNVIFAGRDSSVYCLDSEDGSFVWNYESGQIISSSLLLVDDNIAFGDNKYDLVMISARDGKPAARYETHILPLQDMAYRDSMVIFLGGYDDARPRDVIAFDLRSETERWRATVDNDDSYWFVPRIHIYGEYIIVGTNKGKLAAFRIDDGSKAWEYDVSGPIRGIGHSGSKLFVGTFNGNLHCFKIGN